MNNQLERWLRRFQPALFAGIACVTFGWAAYAEDVDPPSTAFLEIASIDGFSDSLAQRDVGPVSITVMDATEDLGQEKLAWAMAMMGELERVRKTPGERDLSRVVDVLAFRSWCLESAGKGNLLLATAAEETAVGILFRDIASGGVSVGEAQRLSGTLSTDGPPADYWMATLELEGHPGTKMISLDPDAPEYLRIASIFNVLWNDSSELGVKPSLPDATGWWGGNPDTVTSLELVIRTMNLSRKIVALETCLAIENAMGYIPTERDEFEKAAEKHARGILTKRDRMGGWIRICGMNKTS